MQDGLDLINAVAAHPETGPRLARKLYAFFVSEFTTPPETFIQELAGVYYSSGYDMRSVVRHLLHSAEFQNPVTYFARYSWPVEYVVRLIKAAGTPESLLAYMRDRLAPADYDTQASNDLLNYLYAGGAWTSGGAQVRIKVAGLAHLIGGSSEYQFV